MWKKLCELVSSMLVKCKDFKKKFDEKYDVDPRHSGFMCWMGGVLLLGILIWLLQGMKCIMVLINAVVFVVSATICFFFMRHLDKCVQLETEKVESRSVNPIQRWVDAFRHQDKE